MRRPEWLQAPRPKRLSGRVSTALVAASDSTPTGYWARGCTTGDE